MRNVDELRKLTKEELFEKKRSDVTEFRKIKFNLKSGDVTGENIKKLRELKYEIARISTVLNEMDLVNENSNEKESE